MKQYVIETRHLSKRYGAVSALEQINLHIPKGSIYGLIGDNGAGKTSLLKLLAGQTFADTGEIFLFGKSDKESLPFIRKRMGVLVEQAKFIPTLSVEQNLLYFSIQKGIPKQPIDELLLLTGLEKKKKSKAASLSLGQKQRLGLAIALIGNPQLLLLDEPINGLDPSGMIEFRHLLQQLNQERNTTILISSHILSELQQVATHYAFLNKGRLIREITAQELHDESVHALEITLSNTEQFAVLLEKYFPQDHFLILPDDRIRISNPSQPAEQYSRLAAEHHLYFKSMEEKESSLEEYHHRLKTEGEAL